MNKGFQKKLHFCATKMARRKGFEPPVFGIGIRCIIQLCYRRTVISEVSESRHFLSDLRFTRRFSRYMPQALPESL